MRAVIAEDLALLRAGLERLLTAHDIEVVRTVSDGPSLVEAVVELHPDVAVVDVRMPPSFTDEGLRAALEARRQVEGLGVLVLSQYVEPGYAAELLADGHGGVGYLLKERVGDTREFVDAVRRVAAGGAALAPRGARRGGRRAPRPRGGRALRGARAPRAAAGSDRARARGARPDGRGPLQRRDRQRAHRHGGRGREARDRHLRQARPGRSGLRQPARPRRPRLPARARIDLVAPPAGTHAVRRPLITAWLCPRPSDGVGTPLYADRMSGERATSGAPVDQRQAQILGLVEQQGFVRVAGLASRFGVSTVTVRSDLAARGPHGRLRRVRGGAVPPSVLRAEQPYEVAAADLAAEKAAIGRYAASLVADGDTVVLDV